MAYKFALDPTPAQERVLKTHAGAARFAFNWGLSQVKANIDQRNAELTYGLGKADLTPYLDWSLYSLRRAWNAAKDRVAPWWRDCSKEAFNTGLSQLATALKSWSVSRKSKRKGKTVGFPRFKARRKARPSIRWTTGTFRCESAHAILPRVGRVRMHEAGDRLITQVVAGAARVMAVSVRYERGRWHAAFTVEQSLAQAGAVKPEAIVGVDLGVKVLATLSTGETIENPRHLGQTLRKVRRLSRALSRKQGPERLDHRQPSNRWRRASALLAKTHGKVADQRRDALHKATTRLAGRYGTVVIEDLHVAGMLANRRLAKHVADASFGEFRRQLEYKVAWHGGTVIVADRWFASSKTCSDCGAVRSKLALSERTYACMTCGMSMDRDLNAAFNLADYGQNYVAASGAETGNGRGADRRTGLAPQVAVKRKPGSKRAGKTRIVPAQGWDCDMSSMESSVATVSTAS